MLTNYLSHFYSLPLASYNNGSSKYCLHLHLTIKPLMSSHVLLCFHYQLCQKKVHNFVLNIKNICRITCSLDFAAWISFLQLQLNFFKLNIYKLRMYQYQYCHLSESIYFYLDQSGESQYQIPDTEIVLMELNNKQ